LRLNVVGSKNYVKLFSLDKWVALKIGGRSYTSAACNLPQYINQNAYKLFDLSMAL